MLIKNGQRTLMIQCILTELLSGGGGGVLRSFSYGYVLTWCSNPTLSEMFRNTKILPCLKYQHEKHNLFEAIFREYFLINEKHHPVKKNF